MAKKSTKKKAKKKTTRKKSTSKRPEKLETRLINNMIELQKVHTDLAEKFDKLSENISHLLALFETSARSFAKQTNIQMNDKDREFLDKIDKLLDQNKTIAKGLTLMEEKMREKVYGPTTQPQRAPPTQNPGYQRSTSPKSGLPEF